MLGFLDVAAGTWVRWGGSLLVRAFSEWMLLKALLGLSVVFRFLVLALRP